MARDPATAPSGTSMITPRRRTNHGETNRPRRDLHLGSKSVARARSTVRISDADPLVHLQTFAAFYHVLQSVAFPALEIISMRDWVFTEQG